MTAHDAGVFAECQCERCAAEGHYYGGSTDPAECGPAEDVRGHVLCASCKAAATVYGERWTPVTVRACPDFTEGPALRLGVDTGRAFTGAVAYLDVDSALELAGALVRAAMELAASASWQLMEQDRLRQVQAHEQQHGQEQMQVQEREDS